MVICGIAGRRRRAAAALTIDGRVVAAVDQAPLGRLDGADDDSRLMPMAAVDACLKLAGIVASDIAKVVCAIGHAPSLEMSAVGRPVHVNATPIAAYRVSRLAAFARLAAAAGGGSAIVADGDAAMLVDSDGAAADLPRTRELLALTCRLATALGMAHSDSGGAIDALERLAADYQSSGEEWFQGFDAPDDRDGINVEAFDRALSRAAKEAGASLNDASSTLVRKARVVADVADAYLTTLASHFGQLAAALGPDVMLSGAVFGSPDFTARIQKAAGQVCRVAPCASGRGAALGAALCGVPLSADAIPTTLALGPGETESEAKAVLENCRLDYLYEPRWPQLLTRVSRLLERGKLVGWFHGRAEFGHPFAGSRSFLCDPSSRYARDNINAFLRRRPLATPIPLSLSSEAEDCLDGASLSPFALTRAFVAEPWRGHLRAVVDSRFRAHAHRVQAGASPLGDLLALHFQRTGVPGLANVPLAAPDDVPAISARDAIRAAYASSADALVIHRFVVVKDYWQMRDEGTA